MYDGAVGVTNLGVTLLWSKQLLKIYSLSKRGTGLGWLDSIACVDHVGTMNNHIRQLPGPTTNLQISIFSCLAV